MTPPSPSSLASITRMTYLTLTTRISDQMMSERMETTGTLPPWAKPALKLSRRAYSGLVPISPNTTPSVATAAAKVTGLAREGEGVASDPPLSGAFMERIETEPGAGGGQSKGFAPDRACLFVTPSDNLNTPLSNKKHQ